MGMWWDPIEIQWAVPDIKPHEAVLYFLDEAGDTEVVIHKTEMKLCFFQSDFHTLICKTGEPVQLYI